MKFKINGHEAYAYTGRGQIDQSQPALIFIHGAQNDHSVWALQSRYFAHHGYRVYALDLPGHGRSQGAAIATIEAIADWVVQVAELMDAQPATLIGHSMGSLVALAAAARSPDAVRAIALIGTAVPMAVSDVLLDAAVNDEQRAYEMIANWSFSSVNHRPGSPGPGFSNYMQAIRLMQRQARGVLLNDFQACNQYEAGLNAADAITCPTLFICGQYDMMTPPRATQKLFDRLDESAKCPAPSMTVLPAGHQLMAEQPDGVLAALKSFIQANSCNG